MQEGMQGHGLWESSLQLQPRAGNCLSSGESEFHGGVAAASEALFLNQILEFHGHIVGVNIWLDSRAARGVSQRQGVGRIRHSEAKSCGFKKPSSARTSQYTQW